MGREAKVEVWWGESAGPCTVLLESDALILRGSIKAKLPLAQLGELRAGATGLHARTSGGMLRLGLSEAVARRWLAKLQAGPPTLAQKLGLGSNTRVAFLDADAELESVARAAGAHVCSSAEASVRIACLSTPADLAALLIALGREPVAPLQSLWIIRGKGPQAGLQEAPIMAALRAIGLSPTKTASVSATRTADRYAPRKA